MALIRVPSLPAGSCHWDGTVNHNPNATVTGPYPRVESGRPIEALNSLLAMLIHTGKLKTQEEVKAKFIYYV